MSHTVWLISNETSNFKPWFWFPSEARRRKFSKFLSNPVCPFQMYEFFFLGSILVIRPRPSNTLMTSYIRLLTPFIFNSDKENSQFSLEDSNRDKNWTQTIMSHTCNLWLIISNNDSPGRQFVLDFDILLVFRFRIIFVFRLILNSIPGSAPGLTSLNRSAMDFEPKQQIRLVECMSTTQGRH